MLWIWNLIKLNSLKLVGWLIGALGLALTLWGLKHRGDSYKEKSEELRAALKSAETGAKVSTGLVEHAYKTNEEEVKHEAIRKESVDNGQRDFFDNDGSRL